jgi:uncharacterized protein YkwD
MSSDVTLPEAEPTVLDIVAAIGEALSLLPIEVELPGILPGERRAPSRGPDPIPPANIAELEKVLLDLVNQERANAGLPPFAPHGPLMDCVRRHTLDMGARPEMFHADLDQQYRVPCCRTCGVGENVGKCLDGDGPSPNNPGTRESVEAIHNGWMNSEEHKRNILNPAFRLIGVSAVQGTDGRIYATQAFLD